MPPRYKGCSRRASTSSTLGGEALFLGFKGRLFGGKVGPSAFRLKTHTLEQVSKPFLQSHLTQQCQTKPTTPGSHTSSWPPVLCSPGWRICIGVEILEGSVSRSNKTLKFQPYPRVLRLCLQVCKLLGKQVRQVNHIGTELSLNPLQVRVLTWLFQGPCMGCGRRQTRQRTSFP